MHHNIINSFTQKNISRLLVIIEESDKNTIDERKFDQKSYGTRILFSVSIKISGRSRLRNVLARDCRLNCQVKTQHLLTCTGAHRSPPTGLWKEGGPTCALGFFVTNTLIGAGLMVKPENIICAIPILYKIRI